MVANTVKLDDLVTEFRNIPHEGAQRGFLCERILSRFHSNTNMSEVVTRYRVYQFKMLISADVCMQEMSKFLVFLQSKGFEIPQ